MSMSISTTLYEFWKEAFQPHSLLYPAAHAILDTEHCANLWRLAASPNSVHYTNFLRKCRERVYFYFVFGCRTKGYRTSTYVREAGKNGPGFQLKCHWKWPQKSLTACLHARPWWLPTRFHESSTIYSYITLGNGRLYLGCTDHQIRSHLEVSRT